MGASLRLGHIIQDSGGKLNDTRVTGGVALEGPALRKTEMGSREALGLSGKAQRPRASGHSDWTLCPPGHGSML